MTMLTFFIPHAINSHAGCGLSHRSIITVVNAPCSGECFHSYSRRDTNRSKERWSRHGVSIYRMPSWLRGPTRARSQRDSQTRPHRRAALRVRNREADTSRIPRSRHYPRFMVVRANLCAPRETCMAPASPPTACNRVGPNLANLTDVPVRFDRRSIIVKSALYLSSPLVEFTRLRVAGACGSSMMIDRSIDRLIVSWIGDRIIRGILPCSLLHVKLITKFCSSTNVFQQTLFQFLILTNDSKSYYFRKKIFEWKVYQKY